MATVSHRTRERAAPAAAYAPSPSGYPPPVESALATTAPLVRVLPPPTLDTETRRNHETGGGLTVKRDRHPGSPARPTLARCFAGPSAASLALWRSVGMDERERDGTVPAVAEVLRLVG